MTLTQQQLQQKIQSLRSQGVDDEYINTRLQSEIQGGRIQIAPEPKSVGGFAGNLGRDLGENLAGILGLPALALKSITQPSTLPETLGAVGSGIVGEYKDLLTKPGETAYNKPISTLFNVLPFLQAGKLATAGKAGKLAKVAETGKVAGAGKAGLLAKTGAKVEQLSKQQVLRGLRANPTQQKNFLKNTGTKLEDFATKYDIYEPNIEKVYSVIDPIQQTFDDLAVNTTKTIPAKNLITAFDNRIKELSTPELLRDPASRTKVEFLKTERDILNQSVKGSDDITISGLTKTRQAIDANTRDFALNPDVASKQRLIGDIYREIISKEAGTKDIGQELSKLYKFRDIVEQQQGLGKGTKALNLTRLGSVTAGGVAGGVPGAITGLLLEQALASPRVIGGISKGGQKLGQILQASRLQLPRPTATQVAVGAGIGRQEQPRGEELLGDILSTGQPTQVTEPTIDVFGGKSKQEVLSLALQSGLNTKELKEVSDLYDLVSGTTKDNKLSATTENRVQLAKSGLRGLDELENIYREDPSKVLKAAIPGKLGARSYDSAAFRAVEGLLRARSGAAIPEPEVRRYMRANLPRFGDTPEDVEFKLAALRRDLEEVASSGATNPIDILQSQGLNL